MLILSREEGIDCMNGMEVTMNGWTLDKKSMLFFLDSDVGSTTRSAKVCARSSVMQNNDGISFDIDTRDDTDDNMEGVPCKVCDTPTFSSSLLPSSLVS